MTANIYKYNHVSYININEFHVKTVQALQKKIGFLLGGHVI